MSDSCASCLFGQTFFTDPQWVTSRLCRHDSPQPSNEWMSRKIAWKIVEDDDWCGEGQDATTRNRFAPLAGDYPKGVFTLPAGTTYTVQNDRITAYSVIHLQPLNQAAGNLLGGAGNAVWWTCVTGSFTVYSAKTAAGTEQFNYAVL
jgi:hypothetical protein